MGSRTLVAAVARRVVADEAEGDVFGLFAVLWQVKHELPTASASDVKHAVVAALAAAIEKHRIVPGEFADRGDEKEAFVPWSTSAAEALARIDLACERERDRDVVWFAPPKLLPLVVHKLRMLQSFHP